MIKKGLKEVFKMYKSKNELTTAMGIWYYNSHKKPTNPEILDYLISKFELPEESASSDDIVEENTEYRIIKMCFHTELQAYSAKSGHTEEFVWYEFAKGIKDEDGEIEEWETLGYNF